MPAYKLEPLEEWQCDTCAAFDRADSDGIVVHECGRPLISRVIRKHNGPQSLVERLIRVEPTPIIAKIHGNEVRRELTRPRYDLIPKEWLDCLAAIFEEGAKKYGDDNWKKGDHRFALDCLNHSMDHLYKFHYNDNSEDQLGKVAWNALAARTLLLGKKAR